MAGVWGDELWSSARCVGGALGRPAWQRSPPGDSTGFVHLREFSNNSFANEPVHGQSNGLGETLVVPVPCKSG